MARLIEVAKHALSEAGNLEMGSWHNEIHGCGNTITITERADHAAMVPALATETARLAKRVQRVARRRAKQDQPR